MPHFDEDDRDEVFEKDSKESKEFKENGEEMDVDVDDDQSNGHDTNNKSQINAKNDHNKENSAVLQDLLMKKEAEMKMETNGQDQDDEITKGVLAKLSSEILVTPKAEAKIDMKFLPKVTPNGEKLNIFNHTSNLNMTMSSVILNGENFLFFKILKGG